MPSVESFSVTSRRLEHGPLIELVGEVDLATAAIAEAELERADSSQGVVMLDLSAVTFMDSTGVRMVIRADQRLRKRGATLRIVRLPPQLEKLFKLVGIAEHLTIDPQLDGGSRLDTDS